jgi:thioredoxin-related protein
MVKIAFKFKGIVPLINWVSLIAQIKKEFPKIDFDTDYISAKFEQIRKPKTYSQLKYFHSDGFLGLIVKAYKHAQEQVPINKKKAKEWAKFQIKTHPDIMFVDEVKNVLGKTTGYMPRSLSDASKEEMSYIIEWCTKTYSEYYGVEFETVEQYKKRYGLK